MVLLCYAPVTWVSADENFDGVSHWAFTLSRKTADDLCDVLDQLFGATSTICGD